jgi:tetratricopeptide (TPR) repeat protein
MRSFSSRLSSAALFGVLVARHAAAQEGCAPGPGESAREHAKAEYGSGLAAYEEQHYREAIDHLTCANTLVPSAELAFNIAVTYDAMGDTPSALRWYREYRRQGGNDAESAAVLEKVAELESALQARGVQQVTIVSSPAGATLRVDEQPMGLTPFTLELKPGRHGYQLTAPGLTSVESTFDLRADRSLDVVVELEPLHEAPAPSVASSAPATRVAEASFVSRIGTWTWVSLGAGTLLLGGALGVELRRRQLDSELDGVPQEQYPDRYDEMSTHQTMARVLCGAGAAALATGGVLLVLDASRKPAALEVALAPCAKGVCMAAGGAF